MTAPSHQARPWRWAPLVLLVVAAIALVWSSCAVRARITTGSSSPTPASWSRATVVRIGGTPAGTVKSIELTDDGQAADRHQGRRSLRAAARGHDGDDPPDRPDRRRRPLRRRQPGADLPARARRRRPISGDKTTPIVDLDQLFNTLDPKTRKGLQQFIDGSASWYEGKEQQANASAQAFPAALSELDQLAAELSSDDANLRALPHQDRRCARRARRARASS